MNWARWWSGSTSQISPYGALNLDADRCNIVKINRWSDPEYTIRLKKTVVPKIGMQCLFFNRTWSFIMYPKLIFPSWRKATPVFRNCLLLFVPSAAVVQWSIASVCARHAGDLGLIPVRVRRKSLSKQVVSAPMQYTRQKVWVSRVLGDDHFTVGVAHQNTLTA